MSQSATIIGGSMAGLFAANALCQKGWDVSIHEKVPVPLSGRGAGIAIPAPRPDNGTGTFS